jgi:hypothetical protein
MGWSGRARPCQHEKLARGAQDKEHAMSQKLNAAIAVIGIEASAPTFMSEKGQKAKYSRRADVVCSAPNNGHEATARGCWFSAMGRHTGDSPAKFAAREALMSARILTGK